MQYAWVVSTIQLNEYCFETAAFRPAATPRVGYIGAATMWSTPQFKQRYTSQDAARLGHAMLTAQLREQGPVEEYFLGVSSC